MQLTKCPSYVVRYEVHLVEQILLKVRQVVRVGQPAGHAGDDDLVLGLDHGGLVLGADDAALVRHDAAGSRR